MVTAVALLATPLAAGAATSHEDRQQAIQQEITRLRAELDEVAADEAEVLADVRVTQRRRAEEEARLAAVDAEYRAATAALAAAQAEVDAASAAERQVEHRLERVHRRLADARQLLKDQAVAAFMTFGSGAAKLDIVLEAGDIRELRDAKQFVSTIAEQQAKVVNRFAAIEADTAELEAEAARTRAEAAERRNEVKAKTQEVESARARQALAAAAVAAEAQHEQALLDALSGRRSEYERRIREQQRESDAIAELLRQRGRAGTAISGRGSLSSPLGDPVVTSAYGYRIHPIFGDRRLHTGLDFRAATGTPISAAGPGEVIFAGWRGGYGNCTIVDHGGGVATLYAHQRAVRVAVGDEVTRGQVIGAAGATGYATGPHLHFEVRKDGVPVDPMAYL